MVYCGWVGVGVGGGCFVVRSLWQSRALLWNKQTLCSILLAVAGGWCWFAVRKIPLTCCWLVLIWCEKITATGCQQNRVNNSYTLFFLSANALIQVLFWKKIWRPFGVPNVIYIQPTSGCSLAATSMQEVVFKIVASLIKISLFWLNVGVLSWCTCLNKHSGHELVPLTVTTE